MSLIPLFPLQLVLFPGDKLPLHIFEPRYREMARECIDSATPFGVVSYIDNKVSRVGTLAKIAKVEKMYEDGKCDIVCYGTDRFISHSYNSSRAFLQASVTGFKDEKKLGASDKALLANVLKRFEVLSELASLKLENPGLPTPENAFGFGHLIGFDLAQKQNLLEIKTERERLLFVLGQIERSIPQLEAFQDVRKLVKSNGHFKEFPPINFKIE